MFKYRTSFENFVTASLNFDNNVLVSKASLESLKSLIPSSVNLDANVDLIGAAFNAALVNKFNKNGDGIDTNTAIAFKKYFIHKPTNIEHKKQRVVGHIVNSAFSAIGSNEILSDEEVKDKLNPFNISLAAVVYKTVDRNFADALMESNDPESHLFQRISASWEIGFNEYMVAVGSSDLSQAEIITDKKQIEEFKKYLRGFDGPGVMNDGTPVYRLVTGRIYPLGIGFTTNPAADVQGVIIDDGSSDLIKNDSEAEEIESFEVNSLDLLRINKKIFSQEQKTTVNTSKINTMDLEQILSAFKTVLAEKQEAVSFNEEALANISHKIAESIKSKNDEFKSQLQAAEEAKIKAVAEAEKLRDDLNATISKLGELEAAVTAKNSQELFNTRMGVLDQEFDFDDLDRTILAKEITSLDGSDEAFASYKEKLSVVYRHKSKAFKTEQEKAFQDRLEAELAKRIKDVQPVAQATEKTVQVETALANAKTEATVISSQIEVTEAQPSWKEKIAKAFSKENITIKY